MDPRSNQHDHDHDHNHRGRGGQFGGGAFIGDPSPGKDQGAVGDGQHQRNMLLDYQYAGSSVNGDGA